MRKNLGAKHYLYPQPVLMIASYNEDETVNVMNAAWGCVVDTDKIAIVLSNHKTTQNILRTKALSVSMATKHYIKEIDYVGVVSALKNPNKMDKVNWHYTESAFVKAPIIDELPICLECELESYDLESEIMICKIINTSVDSTYLDEDNKLLVSEMGLIAYDGANHTYLELGEKVGNAFKDGFSLKDE